MAEANTSQSMSLSKPPILTAALDTQPRKTTYVKIGLRNKTPLSAESVIKSFYISVFHSLQIASNGHTISYNGNCIHGQMAWVQNRGLDFGSPDHLSRFSFFTSNNRKTASISSDRSKLLISSSCRPESDGYRKIHCQSLSLSEKKGI